MSISAALLQRVLEWRRDIHQHPELSNREFRTAAKVADHLRALGLTPKTGIAHTGVTAVLKGARPGPKIAIRADMDALPVTERTNLPFASTVTAEYQGETVGVMHACGHDAHTAILMGVSEALVSIKDELAGEVMFVFQPSEEGAPVGEQGGAKYMLDDGVFDEYIPEAMFGLHVIANIPVGSIAVRPGPTLAGADTFEIRVIGRQTHGAQPWSGVDSVVAAAEIVTSAQTIVSRRTNIAKLPAVLTFSAINGGMRHNIIPDEVTIIGTLRCFDEQMRETILADLINVAEHIAAAHGARVDAKVPLPALEGGIRVPVTVNDHALTARMRPSLEAAVGADKVFEPPLIMGGEDFSWFAREVPAMFFLVGGTPPSDVGRAPDHHSPEFFIDEGSLEIGVRAMFQVARDYLR